MDNLSPVTADPDVPTKKYVDDAGAQYVKKAGDSMTGSLTMNGNTVWLNSAGSIGIRENGGAIEFVI